MSRLALVVEDDTAMQAIYDRMLTSLGYEIIAAHNGEDAIEILDDVTPDIIFLDVLLPNVNGLEVMQFINDTPRLHPVRVIIASSNGQFEKDVYSNPNAEFILKPLRPAKIRELAE